jgi:hypothetical protein
MKEIGKEVESSLRLTYQDKWKEALLVHLLIGLGRSLKKRGDNSNLLLYEEPHIREIHREESEEAIRKLHENPLGYVRLANEKLADELENELRGVKRGPIKHDSKRNFPEFGELLEAIGIQAQLRLQSCGDDEFADLLESVIQVSWEEAPLSVRENTTRIITLLTFLSASI